MTEYETVTQTARGVAKSTCQLFLYREDRIGVPRAHECCILFKFNNKFYCLSNAHVLGDEYMGRAFVFTSKNNLNGKGKVATIGGQYYCTQLPPSRNREDDTIDMSVVQLSTESVNDLIDRGYHFIEITDIETNYSPQERDKLLIAGYPGSGTKVNTYLRNVIAKPFYLVTTPHFEDFKSLNYPKEFHTVAKYMRAKIFNPKSGEIRKGPLPHGVSGSGLWLLTKDADGNQKALLIGILSTYFKNRNLVASTKIELFIDLIKQKFDPTIPNKGVGVKILN